MALSGNSRVAVTAHNELVFSWAAFQNITQNQSVINWSMKLTADGQGALSCPTAAQWMVTVGGMSQSAFHEIFLEAGETLGLASGKITLDHDENGEKSFTYQFSQDFPVDYAGKTLGTVGGTGEAVLNTILRPSRPTASLEEVVMGTPVTIFTNQMGGLVHVLEYSFGSLSGVIARDVRDSVVWTPDISLASQLPTAETGVAKIRCKTYLGTVLLGTRELALSLVVPRNLVPGILLFAEDLTPGAEVFGKLVQNVSRLAVECETTPAWGSPIVKTELTLDGKRYAGGILREAGSHTLTASVTDSRGHTAYAAMALTVLPYRQPSLRIRASRCREDGTADDVGAFARITVTGTVAPEDGKNAGQLLVQWGEEQETAALGEGEFRWERIVAVSTEETMEIRAEARDALLAAIRTMVLSTGYATMDFLAGGKGVSFGKMANRPGFDCAMEAYFSAGINGLRFGPFGETDVSGPALAAVSQGTKWGIFGLKVMENTLESARLAGNLDTEIVLIQGRPGAEGCSGWIIGTA